MATPEDHISNHQAEQFAMRWLAIAGNGEATPSQSVDSVTGTSVPCPKVPGGRSVSRHEAIAPGLKIGLFGRHSAFGLGNVHRDMVMNLSIDRWLVCCFPGWGDIPPQDLPCRIDVATSNLAPTEIERWLHGLDVVIFVETPVLAGVTTIARRLGIRVVCVPMWEYLHLGQEWLEDVDLMLCPTRCSAEMLSHWKVRFGFNWDVEFVPWPIDSGRFEFRRRDVCRKFVFVNGSGGAPALGRGSSAVRFRRKGLNVLLEAARLVPEIPIIVYTTVPVRGATANVDVRRPPTLNSLLYCDGDICVQPSHWEGLGLPLLECQAAGMPLITTDSPPMNEHNAFARIPASKEVAYLSPQLCIVAAHIRPEDLADVLLLCAWPADWSRQPASPSIYRTRTQLAKCRTKDHAQALRTGFSKEAFT